ncbi:MAG: murein L,D-transpeptidase [Bacteroidota bacterium]
MPDAPNSRLAHRFYRDNGFDYVWIRPSGFSFAAKSFLSKLHDAESQGVDPEKLHADSISSMMDEMLRVFPVDRPSERLIALEVGLTLAWFEYAQIVFRGLPDKTRHELQWFLPDRRMEMASTLQRFLSDSLSAENFNPLHVQYGWMVEQIRRLLAVNGSFWEQPLNVNRPLEVVCDSAKLSILRNRFIQLGDLDESAYGPGALSAAIRHFRLRHGLGDESELNRETLEALNVPPKERVRQLLINLERCRWLPDADTGRFIVVNVPDFRLGYFHADALLWSCGVVVGKSKTPTAVFAGQISEVVFNPYWYVPKSILEEELVPEFQQDPERVGRQHYEVVTRTRPPRVIQSSVDWDTVDVDRFPYDVRQTPGPWNPLGRIKFLFPNNFDMYLHDTPAKDLFGRRVRAFSHGCIRVEEPFRLLELISDGEMALKSSLTSQYFQNREEVHVPLKSRVPVYIVYLTAWVDQNGLNFRDDVYGLDDLLEKELFK